MPPVLYPRTTAKENLGINLRFGGGLRTYAKNAAEFDEDFVDVDTIYSFMTQYPLYHQYGIQRQHG